MRLWYLVPALMLAACASPKIDGSSPEKFQESTKAVRESLSPDKRAKFDAAITQFVFSAAGNAFTSGGTPDQMESGLAHTLDGLTADGVIARADSVTAARQAEQRKQALAEIAELKARRAGTDSGTAKLRGFSVVSSRFHLERDYGMKQPVIDLTVRNGTSSPVARAYFRGVVASPGRSVPWISDDFTYDINGGLEPGETATWHLSPNPFSGWGTTVPADAVLTVETVKLEGLNETVIGERKPWTAEDDARLKELEKNFGA
jgi:hypothetical protein